MFQKNNKNKKQIVDNVFLTRYERVNTLTDRYHFLKFTIGTSVPPIRTHFSITPITVIKFLLL